MQDTVSARLRAGGNVTRAAVLATIALAAVAGACGSDDSSGPDQAKSNSSIKPPTGNDKQQIGQLIKNMQAYYIQGDAENYCASLTAGGRKMVAEVGKPYKMGSSCEEFISRTSKLTRQAKIKQKPTVLLAVRVRGDKAVATVSDGGRSAQSVALVKVGGEWKVPDPGIRDPLASPKQTQPAGGNGSVQ
jgi:hypothetical protein